MSYALNATAVIAIVCSVFSIVRASRRLRRYRYMASRVAARARVCDELRLPTHPTLQ